MISFLRWGTFQDTGRPYRVWKFTEDPHVRGIEAGDYLYDLGVDIPIGASRWRVVHKPGTSSARVIILTASEVRRFFPDEQVPGWDRFGHALQALAKALRYGAEDDQQKARDLLRHLEGTINSIGHRQAMKERFRRDALRLMALRISNPDSGGPWTAFAATSAVPEIGLGVCDLLVAIHDPYNPPVFTCEPVSLSGERYEALVRIARGEGGERFVLAAGHMPPKQVNNPLWMMIQAGMKDLEVTPVWVIVRAFEPSATHAVEADSEAEAIRLLFEGLPED